MTNERVYYSDANGIRVGNREMVFGDKRYAPRNVTSSAIATERRRTWPGYMMMLAGAAIMGYAISQVDYSVAMLGVAAFLGGSFYIRRRRPTYALQLTTAKGPVLVVASKNKAFLDGIKGAVDKAIAAAQAPREA
jgi:hypothetical protein